MSDSRYSGPWPSQLPTGSFPGMTPPPPRVERPATVKVAFWGIVVLAVLPLIALPFQMQSVSNGVYAGLAQMPVQSRRALPAGFAEQIISIMIPAVWIIVLIVAAVTILIGLGIWTGRNWVRIVLTVLAGIMTATTLIGYVFLLAAPTYASTQYARMGESPVGSSILSFLQLAAWVAIIVLIWLPASNYFFAMSRAARSVYRR